MPDDEMRSILMRTGLYWGLFPFCFVLGRELLLLLLLFP